MIVYGFITRNGGLSRFHVFLPSFLGFYVVLELRISSNFLQSINQFLAEVYTIIASVIWGNYASVEIPSINRVVFDRYFQAFPWVHQALA